MRSGPGPVLDDGCLGGGAQLFFGDAVGQFHDFQAAFDHVQNPWVQRESGSQWNDQIAHMAENRQEIVFWRIVMSCVMWMMMMMMMKV